jgi:threonine synthase
VPAAIGDFLILDAIRESKGFAIAVDDDAIDAARTEVGTQEGLLLCPEGAATYAALAGALAEGLIGKHERVMLFNCATGLKYPMPEPSAKIDKDAAIDFARL